MRRSATEIKRYRVLLRLIPIILGIILLVLILTYIVTILYDRYGSFSVSINKFANVRYALTLSETDDFSTPVSRLNSKASVDITNIDGTELPLDLDTQDGEHNGKNYLAYTFYLHNNGKETLKYQSQLQAVKAAKDADEACRVLVYKNGEPEVFAKENRGLTSADGKPEAFEKIFKKEIPENFTPPTKEEIEAAAEQPQNKEPVAHTDEEIVIQPFVDSKTVFNTEVDGLEPGATDKYTIVMWIEGEDPECLDVIRGGYVKLMWFFNIADEEL